MVLQMKQLSECAMLIEVGEEISEQTHARIQQIIKHITSQQLRSITELVNSYTNVCVYYDPMQLKKELAHIEGNTAAQKLMTFLRDVLQQPMSTVEQTGRTIDIPVYYGGEYGPDLAYVAAHHNMTEQQVIDIHTSGDYFVHMLGFAPGFPFLGGLDARIATLRKETPRLFIEAGSVGIAGTQTGVYPLATPGGWQIIGRTMLPLFLPNETPPTLLRAGDRVRFVAVKEDQSCYL